jgi:hypothetical protein
MPTIEEREALSISIHRIYRKKEFLALLGIGEVAWKKLKMRGLKSVLTGKSVFVHGAELGRWIQENSSVEPMLHAGS